MAQFVLTNAFVKIDAVDYSNKAASVAVSMSAEALEVTAMGDYTRKNIGGLIDWAMEFEFNADEGASGTGSAFFAMLGKVVPIEVRGSAAAVGVSNPSYKGDGLLVDYQPIEGDVGSAHKVSLSFVSAGPLTRVTV